MSTLFDFGWNAADSDARELPWNQPKPGTEQDRKNAARSDPSKAALQDHRAVPNSVPVSVLDIEVELVCNYVRKQIRLMTATVRKVSRQHMSPSAAALLKQAQEASGEGTLLHGSDVPKQKAKEPFTVEVLAFRPAPEGFSGALGILDLKEVFGCSAWALNKTNFKAVIKVFGDNTDKWKGKLKLQVIQVRNPKSGTFGPSLAVAQ